MSEPNLCQRLSSKFPRITLLVAMATSMARAIERAVRPGQRAWHGAANGLLAVTLFLLAAVIFYSALLPTPTVGRLLATGGRLGQALAAGVGVLVGAWALFKLPSRYRWSLAICGTALFLLFSNFGDQGVLVTLYVVVAASAAGAGLRVTGRGGLRELGRLRRAVTVFGMLAGMAALVAAGVWIAGDGPEPVEMRNAALEADADVPQLQLPNPGLPGPHAVSYLTYGSGEDHRLEYGRNVDLIAGRVDGSDFVDRWNDRRTDFWGFEEDEMPLQGRVWHPDGEGPFPLVLIVHGNHSMEEYSDPGYAYLGELLASRGFIFVSVDENFVNGSAVGGLREENDARGWLLLEHLRQWGEWNDDPEHMFAGKVDMSRLGLIGHSRGGEAVGVAAAFNRLSHYPDDATIEFDYGFDIGAVIAIAPVYGQYQPGGRLTQLTDVNYMSIHGANDGDVTQFDGARQFQNVRFTGTDYRFKATTYVFGANHGQFNTVWGNSDWGMPFGRILNRRALISGEDQRQAGKVFMSAFLEAGLNDRTEYLDLFIDPRRGADWLPETIYITDFQDSRTRILTDFDEDVDVTTASLPGGRTWGENLTVWREDRLQFKYRDKETSAVYLGWYAEDDAEGEEGEHEHSQEGDAGENTGEDTEENMLEAAVEAAISPAEAAMPSRQANGARLEPRGGELRMDGSDAPQPARYWIELPDGFDASGATELFLAITDANESPEPDDEDEEDGDNDAERQGDHDQSQGQHEAPNDVALAQDNVSHQSGEEGNAGDEDEDPEQDEPREPLDFTLRLTDAAGNAAQVPLSRFSAVQPQLEVQIRRGLFGESETESEAIPQRFTLPFAWFTEANPSFEPASLHRIELVFDRTDEGVIALDRVGIR